MELIFDKVDKNHPRVHEILHLEVFFGLLNSKMKLIFYIFAVLTRILPNIEGPQQRALVYFIFFNFILLSYFIYFYFYLVCVRVWAAIFASKSKTDGVGPIRYIVVTIAISLITREQSSNIKLKYTLIRSSVTTITDTTRNICITNNNGVGKMRIGIFHEEMAFC